MTGFYYARMAPNPHGGEKKPVYPWAQVVLNDNGKDSVHLDCILSADTAKKLASKANLCL